MNMDLNQLFQSGWRKVDVFFHVLYWPSLAAAVVLCLRFLVWVPSAGVAIGALGAAGVLVAIRGNDLSREHKVAWAVITLVLLVTEVRAIRKQDEEHAQTMKAILNTYRDAMAQNQGHFEDTMGKLETQTSRLEAVSKDEEAIAKLSKENIAQTTGAKAFCWIQAVTLDLPNQGSEVQFPVYAFNPTNYPFYGADVQIGFVDRLPMHISFGDIAPQGMKSTTFRIPFRKDRDNHNRIQICSNRSFCFIENLAVTWNNNTWNQDYELWRTDKNQTVLHSIKKDFPYLTPQH